MEIILGKHAGFCFGVKRAVSIANEHFGEKNVYTLGPIIHNKEVIKELTENGIVSVTLDELDSLPRGTVIIRSHGIAKAVEEKLYELGFSVLDATCPYVKKIHELVADYSKKGYHIIISGDPNHAEVQGIVGWIENIEKYEDQKPFTVIQTEEEARKFSLNTTNPVFFVSQTTFNYQKFEEYVEIVKEKGYDVVALDTICKTTYQRQVEVEQIASKVDAMIVIGDRSSSNTRKLFDIAKGKCKTYFLQTKEDLDTNVLHSIGTVGITAGASTPDKLIREVMLECQK